MAETVDDDLVWMVRRHIYATIAARGVPPNVTSTAGALELPTEIIRVAYRRLHELHAVFLEPGGEAVRMAHPFSGIPTRFRVRSGGIDYWANCAWDMLGIPAALQADAEADAFVAEDGQSARIDVTNGRIRGDGFVHFPLPFRRWYDDLIFT